ncbi:MAG TPA: hypothetical protein VD905_18865, partial [Flavobacteriales bacterium]|nr:hypothetical protein [Flavobacteriales bacterium]
GTGSHLIEIFFHFSPVLHVELDAQQALLIRNVQNNLFLKMKLDQKLQATLLDGHYAKKFGLTQKNIVLKLTIQAQLPLQFTQTLEWS